MKAGARRSGRSGRGSVRRGQLRRFLLGHLLFWCVLVLAGAVLWLDHVVRRDFSRLHWSQPARVYARPLELHAERGIGADELVEVLRILGYRQEATATATGSFAQSANVVTMRTRGFQSWDGAEPPRAVQIRFAGNAISDLADPETGAPVPRVRLEPIEFAQFDAIDRQDRIVVAIADVPQHLINALLAVEDHNFYDHVGIDPAAVLRAMLANLLAREVVQGGSTLTQQLVKNLYLTAERSLWRKLREACIALIIELHFTKQEILQAYLNEVYLGQQGNRAVHGFGLAAQHYLGKRIQDLSLDETCLLAGLARGASYYNPFRHPERARQRRNFVLQRMRSEGFIDATTELVAAQRELGLVERSAASAGAYSDFMDLVRLQLAEHFPAAVLRTQGLRIMTSLDYLTQRQVAAAIDRTLPELGKRSPKRLGSAQAAVLVTDVRSGDILALSGGRDNAPGDFNRAVTARRPVGSLLKPAVYLAALESGRYHLASIIPDRPLTVRLGDGQAWRPQNYSGSFSGEARILEALPESLNLPAVHLGLEVGLETVAESIRRLGFRGSFTPYPSIILGAIELSSVEIAAMYQTLASGGLHMPLRAVQAVTSADGRMLAHYAPEAARVIPRDTAYLLEFLLRRVLQTGTARLAGERLAAMAPLAGKTGSTNDLRDSWFVGYGDDYLGVVWLGRDDNQPIGLTGASGAMPIWIDLMQRIRPRPRTFAPPPEIEWLSVDIDPFNLERCAKVMALPFRRGTVPAPEEICAVAGDPARLKTEAGSR